MICPMCHQETNDYDNSYDRCLTCDITYYSIRYMQSPLTYLSKKFAEQHPNQAGYYFRMHNKYYTLEEMERLCRLKAFL
jgi:hypothetical protein